MLHVTNGTSVSLAETGIGGEVLAWVDILHEGPVPGGFDLPELTRIRGKFLDLQSPGPASAVDTLVRRNQILERFAARDEVTLWFEHDLYDQLQLIQILDFFHQRRGAAEHVALICVDRYLGPLTGQELAALWPARHSVTPAELELAASAWAAFRSPDPTAIEVLLRQDTSALPFLAGALLRHLQQYPSVAAGLARTERQILQLLAAAPRDFDSLYLAGQQLEERIFMGDTTFAAWLKGLLHCRRPLAQQSGDTYTLTRAGEDVLAGRADHIRFNGINRWLGGVHLQGSDALWRWNEATRSLVPH